jgi:5-methylcytosine-specific restriction endonuclease McrA
MEDEARKLFSNINWDKLLTDIRWTSKCKIIKSRDNFKCVNCRSTDKLAVHHRQYHFVKSLYRLKYPWDYPDELLITLCQKCHGKGHAAYKIKIINI